MLPDGVRRLFRLAKRKPDIESELDDELCFHFEQKTRQLVHSGMSETEALAEARRQFGDVGAARRAMYRSDQNHSRRRLRLEWVAEVAHDARLALRGLIRSPGLTAAIIVMLGLGVGGASAMLGLLDRLLFSVSPHVRDPNELRRLYVFEHDSYRNESGYHASYGVPTIRRLSEAFPRNMPFAGLAQWRDRFGGLGGPRIWIGWVTGEAFDVLGTTAFRGRLLTPEDDAPGAAPAAVLSHELWSREFGSSDSAIGASILLGRQPYTVVGITQRGFSGLRPDRIDAWVPASIAGPATYGPEWGSVMQVFDAIVRVPAGTDVAPHVIAAQRIYRGERSARQRDTSATLSLESVLPFKRPGPRSERARLSLVASGVAAILCLIAAANVTNLLLLRAVQRRRETAVRIALGAGRRRLIQAVVIESVILGLAGAGCAGLVAMWGGELLRKLIVATDWQFGLLDPRVMPVAGVLGLLIALITGLVPGWLSSRPETVASLKAGAGAGVVRSRFRSGLLVFQSSLAVVLVTGLALYTSSFLKASDVDYGVDADQIISIQVRPDAADSTAPATSIAMVTAELAERMRTVPGVEGVAMANIAPIMGYGGAMVRAEGVDSITMNEHGPFISEIDSAFLQVTGLPLVRGRAFTGNEVATRAPVALVNDAFARRFWPGQEAIGKCLYVGSAAEAASRQCRSVIGVVGSYRNRLREEEAMQLYYLPLAYYWDGRRGGHSLVVRVAGDAERMVPTLLNLLRERLPRSDPEAVRDVHSIVQRELDPWRKGTTLFGLFAGLAVLLAIGGLYSVVTYSVVQRKREFGIRIAMGATAWDLMLIVARIALSPVLLGLGVGMALTLWLVKFVAPLLYETGPRDPAALAGAALAMLLAAIIASITPARSAARTDPREVLQSE